MRDYVTAEDLQKSRELVATTDLFAETFLAIERDVFFQAGMDPDAVDFLLSEMAQLRDAIRLDDDLFLGGVLNNLRRLQQQTCAIANLLQADADEFIQNSRSRRRLRINVVAAMLGIGGAGVIELNASGTMVTGGLAAPIGAISAASGSAVISGAVATTTAMLIGP